MASGITFTEFSIRIDDNNWFGISYDAQGSQSKNIKKDTSILTMTYDGRLLILLYDLKTNQIKNASTNKRINIYMHPICKIHHNKLTALGVTLDRVKHIHLSLINITDIKQLPNMNKILSLFCKHT